jgi:hypothetical protein
MAKSKDGKAKYARRMARGAERGLSKAQARGHARVRPPDDPERIGELPGKLEYVLRHMRRDGLSLTKAARREGVSPERARRWIVDQGLAVRDGRGWRFPDNRLRDIELYSAGERKVIRIRGFDPAHLIGRYMSEAAQAMLTNSPAPLAPFEGRFVRDVDGRVHVFETDLNVLYRLNATGDIFESLYRFVN